MEKLPKPAGLHPQKSGALHKMQCSMLENGKGSPRGIVKSTAGMGLECRYDDTRRRVVQP